MPYVAERADDWCADTGYRTSEVGRNDDIGVSSDPSQGKFGLLLKHTTRRKRGSRRHEPHARRRGHTPEGLRPEDCDLVFRVCLGPTTQEPIHHRSRARKLVRRETEVEEDGAWSYAIPARHSGEASAARSPSPSLCRPAGARSTGRGNYRAGMRYDRCGPRLAEPGSGGRGADAVYAVTLSSAAEGPFARADSEVGSLIE